MAFHTYAPANVWKSSMLLPTTMHTICSRNVRYFVGNVAIVLGKMFENTQGLVPRALINPLNPKPKKKFTEKPMVINFISKILKAVIDIQYLTS